MSEENNEITSRRVTDETINNVVKPITFLFLIAGMASGFYYASVGIIPGVIAGYLMMLLAVITYVQVDKLTEGSMFNVFERIENIINK